MKLRNGIFYETPAEHGAGAASVPAPGTGEASGEAPPDTGAGPSIPDSGGSPPQTIPYTRFKEVNDARREIESRLEPYTELEAMGYGPEDLRRLADWETQYALDPTGTWLQHATTLDDLPQEVKDAVAKHASSGSQGTGESGPAASSGDGEPGGGAPQAESGEPPEWAKPLIADFTSRKEAEVRQANSDALDGLLSQWDDLDKADGLVDSDGKSLTPMESKLAHIGAAARVATSHDELLQLARGDFLRSRESILGTQAGFVRNGDTPPKTVPGGGTGSVPPNAPEPPKTLDQARKLAEAAMSTGSLPSLAGR